MTYSWIIPIAAFLIDCALGDPYYPFHPARISGALAVRIEAPVRRALGSTIFSGALAWLAIVGLATIAGVAIPAAFSFLSLKLGSFVFPDIPRHFLTQGARGLAETLIVYACIAPRDLAAHAARVGKALSSSASDPESRLSEARKAVSMIVGRDVQRLDEEGVIRATVESVAESTVDGVIAALFWAFVAGAPGALAYRAINTLDSIWGHRNERYEKFGKFSARADDAATWLPARFSFIAALIALLPLSLTAPRAYCFRKALAIGWRDRRKHASPNSAWLEALFAGALGLRLAGPAWYLSELLDKPYLGESRRAPEVGDIQRSILLMYCICIVSLLGCVIAGIILS
jgi:adenosylcobinamide-phosphate synthase